MESKRKADSVLRFFFSLLSAGKAGISKGRLLSDFECNERTVRRYIALLRASSNQVDIEVGRSADGEPRYRLSLKGASGAPGGDGRLYELMRILFPVVGDDLSECLVLARELLSRPALERCLPLIVDHMERETSVEFTYGGKRYIGVPLCFFIHRDGFYLVVRLEKGCHKFSLSRLERVVASRQLGAPWAGNDEVSRDRDRVMQRLGKSLNAFVSLDRSDPMDITLRFRGFDSGKLKRLFPQALSHSRPEPSDATVHDIRLRFHGWLEASRFFHQYLGSFSILSPAWVGRQFLQEVEREMEDVEA